jgi:hypothetical protein
VLRRDGRSKRTVKVKFADGPADLQIYWENVYPYEVVRFSNVGGIFWQENINLILQVFLILHFKFVNTSFLLMRVQFHFLRYRFPYAGVVFVTLTSVNSAF